MCSSLPLRSVTMRGSEQARRSPRTSPLEPSRSPVPDRSTRRATTGVETEMTTTEVATLPGLETVEAVQPSPDRSHWIQRGPEGKLMLFSGRSNPDLAAAIAEKLGIELGDVHLKTFANGEVYCRYLESIRGADVFVVQSCTGPATNEHLMELLVMIDA